MLDGETVVLGVDGSFDFNALHSGKHDEEVQLCAFDVLAIDGDDLRRLPLSMRKTNLARLLRSRPMTAGAPRRGSCDRRPSACESASCRGKCLLRFHTMCDL